MSDFLKSSFLTDLSSQLNSILGTWPRRNLDYQDLQAEVNKALTDYSICVDYDIAYAVTRRDACRSIMLVPLRLCGLGAAASAVMKIPKDTEGLLLHSAAGIAACWYMRRGKDLHLASEVVSWYIPILEGALSSKSSEAHRKAAAGLLAQCFTLKSKLTNALQDDDQAIAYEERAIQYASLADNIIEQAIANREMALLYQRRKKYSQALPYAEKAYNLAKNAPRIIISFTASGLANCQAANGYLEEAQASLAEAHDSFDPTASIPSLPYGKAVLTDIDARVYQRMGNFKGAMAFYQQVRSLNTSALGAVQTNVEYAKAEVSRDDQDRDMGLCITLLGEAIPAAVSLDSKWYIREAREVYDMLRIAWPREAAVKGLLELFF